MAETYDAVIVGSGASGGWVAKQLTEAGVRVAVMEAGRSLDPAVDYTEHRLAHQMPLRGQLPRAVRDEQEVQQTACDEYANHLFVKDTECPYTTPRASPSSGNAAARWAENRSRGPDRPTGSPTTT